jgi:uncharacterized protein (DUF1501 family)
LPLANNPTTGLHTAMTGLQRMYNEGLVSIIHSVSYPQPSGSHFEASDIYFTGRDRTQTLLTGWTGRYLDGQWPGYPAAYPTKDMPDPLAIQIGYLTSTAFAGTGGPLAVAIPNPDTFAQLVGDKKPINNDLDLKTIAGQRVSFIRQQQLSSVQYAAQIKVGLADQLKIVSRLIHGGLQTRVYYVTINGFDTHANQVVAADTTTGAHANLMRQLSDAVKAFQDDLKLQGIDDRVAGMTFSEFGRRADSNAGLGTDHGLAAPMFVFGKGVKTSVIGKNPDLNDLSGTNVNGSIKMQTDFRQVYSTLLTDWLKASKTEVLSVLQREFVNVPIFQQTLLANEPLAEAFRIYPNPANAAVTLEADLFAQGIDLVQLSDATGRIMDVPVNRLSDRQLGLDVQTLPTGQYIVAVQTAGQRLAGRLLVAR